MHGHFQTIDTVLAHHHLSQVQYWRKYDADRYSYSHSHNKTYKPSKWLSQHVTHPLGTGAAIAVLFACIENHNEETAAKLEESESATSVSAAQTTDAGSKMSTAAMSDTNSAGQAGSTSPASTASTAQSKMTPLGIIDLPQTRADLAAFDAKYRFICCTGAQAHASDVLDQHTGKMTKNWDDMVSPAHSPLEHGRRPLKLMPR